MQIPFLDLSRMDSDLQERLRMKFSQVLEKGIFSGGEEVQILEKTIQQKLNSLYAIPCANGTDALELALRALEIGEGDEVIVPALTWVSTAEAVRMVGAKPIFWDTDVNGLLRSDWVEAITPKTNAVIPVHLYGRMVDMNALAEVARIKGISVIEDAAQAFGAFQDGKAAGIWGSVGCLSFYPTKNLGALGEAGMCLTQDERLAEKIRLLSNHGQPKRDEHMLVGRNSRIDTLQAAFLTVMLEDFEKQQQKRKSLAKIYLEELSDIEGSELPQGLMESNHNAHLFVVKSDKRNELREFLAEHGIGTAIHYPQIIPDMEPYYMEGDFSNARTLANQGLSLPLNPWLKEEEVEKITEAIKSFFTKKS
ncbi:DegT/DnrJ/EryC1/StrS family aminotransferase [Algoriphagus limi]|uniref:DegT/DnrJ/EryC1/StrS family aminotransferase n=1 Tax=Algoriphagus limi TaxID=2975273 RepID=A0ABT2G499_9BACT|nr:DegT/DnrJ/EryC1/StrS family aminotransferase [Algoriphagus limi]MCS5490089.1 DegT/DnrJ/EryC1/StrS family aminotransferase [Algoriphagus limi]